MRIDAGVGIHGEQLLEQVLDRGAELFGHGEGAPCDAAIQVWVGLGPEGEAAAEQGVEQDTHAPHVYGLAFILRAANDLRSHICK